MEDSEWGGESALQSGGREAATAPPDGVPGLQIQTKEETEVRGPAPGLHWQPRPQHDGEAGGGGGVRHARQEETHPELRVQLLLLFLLLFFLLVLYHLQSAGGCTRESLLHLSQPEPESWLLPTSAHSSIEGAFQPRNGEITLANFKSFFEFLNSIEMGENSKYLKHLLLKS